MNATLDFTMRQRNKAGDQDSREFAGRVGRLIIFDDAQQHFFLLPLYRAHHRSRDRVLEEASVNERISVTTSSDFAGQANLQHPLETGVSSRSPQREPYRDPSEARDRKHYVFVFETVQRGASMTEFSREHGQALQRAAEFIKDWNTFRRLCSADIRELWATEHELHRNNRVQNRKRSWQRLFTRFAVLNGLPQHLHFGKTSGYGIYPLTYSSVEQGDEKADWSRFINAAKKVGYPLNVLMAWQRQRDAAAKKLKNT